MATLQNMISLATPTPSAPQFTPMLTGLDEATRAATLKAANINPRTGLATDYLNHFNEAIMLLEMIPDVPDCAADFLEWRPLSYAEHFIASNFKARDLAIEAYELAEPLTRAEFDHMTETMTNILTAVSEAMRDAPDSTRAKLAVQALNWLKELVQATGGIINAGTEGNVDYIMTH